MRVDDAGSWQQVATWHFVTHQLLIAAVSVNLTEVKPTLPLTDLFDRASQFALRKWPRTRFLRDWWLDDGESALSRIRAKELALSVRMSPKQHLLRHDLLDYWQEHLGMDQMDIRTSRDYAYWLFEGVDQAESFLDAVLESVIGSQLVSPVPSAPRIFSQEVIGLANGPSGTASDYAA